jgi:hypothetical protein
MSALTLKDFGRAVRMAAALALAAAIGACAWADPNQQYPENTGGKGNRGGHAGGYSDIGSVFGPGGLSIGNSDAPLEPGQAGPGIGVNSFLWRASLDTMSFMPLASADPFGGVIITDWYSPPETPAERFKVTVYILGRELRADGLRTSVFRQTQDAAGTWVDSGVEPQTGAELENAILVRARQLRIAGLQ